MLASKLASSLKPWPWSYQLKPAFISGSLKGGIVYLRPGQVETRAITQDTWSRETGKPPKLSDLAVFWARMTQIMVRLPGWHHTSQPKHPQGRCFLWGHICGQSPVSPSPHHPGLISSRGAMGALEVWEATGRWGSLDPCGAPGRPPLWPYTEALPRPPQNTALGHSAWMSSFNLTALGRR